MPYSKNTIQLVNRGVSIQPVHGNGWILFGNFIDPLEVDMPESFQVVIQNVLYDSGIAHALIARCKIEIKGHIFYWIGLVPFTDSEVDLMVDDGNCIVTLSSSVLALEKQREHNKVRHLETNANIFVHGSARLSLVK